MRSGCSPGCRRPSCSACRSASSHGNAPARPRPDHRLAEQSGVRATQPGYGMPVAAMDTEFTLTQKRALAVATAVAILFGAYFLRGYFILIVVAAVAAYLFTPLFNRLNGRFGTGMSATLTLLAAIAAVVVPMGLFVFLAVVQITNMVERVTDWVG